jgi:hypothetical protein
MQAAAQAALRLRKAPGPAADRDSEATSLETGRELIKQ